MQAECAKPEAEKEQLKQGGCVSGQFNPGRGEPVQRPLQVQPRQRKTQADEDAQIIARTATCKVSSDASSKSGRFFMTGRQWKL